MVTRTPDIASPGNDRVKAWRRLRSRSERDRSGTFLVEGEREARRIAERLPVVTSIVRIDRSPIDLPHVVTVSDRVFARLSARQNPDGVAVVATTPDLTLEALHVGPDRVILVADGIEKPGNLGAMIRTADGFGAAVVAASPGTDLVNPNVVRSAQGSLFAIPTASAGRDDVREWLIRHDRRVVVADADAATSLWDVDLRDAVAIVVGSEHAGVHPTWHGAGTAASIPMRGRADSFNASVTAAIFLAEAARQADSR